MSVISATDFGHNRSTAALDMPVLPRIWSAVAAGSAFRLLGGYVLAEPADDQVGDLQVVLVDHQHVAVALLADLRQQQQPGGAAGSLDRIDGRNATVAALVAVRSGCTLAVVAPDREQRDLGEGLGDLVLGHWHAIAFDVDEGQHLG